MRRGCRTVFLGTGVRHASPLQPDHTIGVHELVHVMRDQNDGGAAFLQIVEHPHDVGARLRVEHGGRLVQYQHLRIHGEHACNRDALLLAATQPGRIGLAVVLHADGFQRSGDPGPDIIMCDCKILRTEGDIILGDRGDDLIFRMLEDGADAMTGRAVCVGMGAGIIEGDIAEQRDGSRIGRDQPGDHTGQRGFAGTVRAGQTDAFALQDGQVDAIQRPGGAVVIAEANVMQLDDGSVRHQWFSRLEIGL